MAVYILSQLVIHDEATFAPYQRGFVDIWSKYDGDVLAVDDDASVIEGSWPYTRTVILKFPSQAQLDQWYHSAEYQALAAHRKASSTNNFVVLREMDPAVAGAFLQRAEPPVPAPITATTVFALALLTIHDLPQLEGYRDGFAQVWNQFPGDMRAGEDRPLVLEGQWPYHRSVIMSFPSREDFDRWYNSEGYQRITQHRWAGAKTDFVVVKGFVMPEGQA